MARPWLAALAPSSGGTMTSPSGPLGVSLADLDAGSYALGRYDLARQVLDRKIDNVETAGASVLATSCPACIIQLSYGIRLRKLPIRVSHISELLAGR